jgi:hypothetical protein
VREKPSLLATLLLFVVLSLTAWHAIRLWTAFAWYDLLQEFAPTPGPVYMALSGTLWIVTGFALLWNIWQKKARAAKMLFWAATSYTVWYWIDRLVFQAPHANWPFILLLNIILLAYVLVITIPYFSSNDIIERGV